MRILAIDPGQNLGWATNQTGRLEWGTERFSVKNGESSGNRWRRFGEWLVDVTLGPMIQRDYKHMTEFFTAPINEKPKPIQANVDLIVYERATFAARSRAAAEIAGGFTTRLEEHCERHGIALQPVAVQTLKAFAIPAVKRKKGDPKMDRGKAAMICAAELRLPLWGGNPYGVDGSGNLRCGPLTEHEADALWLYFWALENCKP